MQKSIIFIVMFMVFAMHISHAQKILLEEDRTKKDPKNPGWGVNERHFWSFFAGADFVVGSPDSGMTVNYGRSMGATTGLRYKLKLNNIFAIGADASYKYIAYNISQKNGSNTFLDSTFWKDDFTNTDIKHERERLGFHSVSGGLYLRTNFDAKRGNTMGYYLDLGSSADYIIGSEYVAADKINDGMERKQKFKNLPFVNNFQQYYFARLGFNFISFTAKYRVTDHFKDNYNFPEPPRYVAGVEFSLFNK